MTSIITRRREFAMLQFIGMTRKQLLQMLMTEGVCCGAASGAVSLVLGTLVPLVDVRNLTGQLWFFSYRFTLIPLLLVVPILLGIELILSVERQSIVERLRSYFS